MLEIFGTIAGNILSLPGVLGFALGLLTRRIGLAAILGGLVGVFEVMIFAGFSFANVGGLELGVSVAVGIIAGTIGCLVRRKGATV
jgi:hypothetical protein